MVRVIEPEPPAVRIEQVELEAVHSGRVVEASLGYFINPLVNVLLGVLVLHERRVLVVQQTQQERFSVGSTRLLR